MEIVCVGESLRKLAEHMKQIRNLPFEVLEEVSEAERNVERAGTFRNDVE